MSEIEWFKRFSEIPEISWEPPVGIEVDPRWSAARPVVETIESDERTLTIVSWRDPDGNPFADDFTFGSPAHTAGYAVREGSGTLEVLTIVSTSLSLPGTRRDYYDAMDQAISALFQIDDDDPTRIAWIESLAWLAVSLLRTGLEETLMPAQKEFAQRPIYGRAAMPYITLLRLYLREGFLREAAAVYDELRKLPQEARRWPEDLDPHKVMARLRELQGSVEVRE
jgi:hypothetical protein